MAYRGIKVPIVLGRGGLNADKNFDEIPITDLIQAQNITLDQGMIEKEGGTSKLNTTAISGAPKVTALIDWWPTETTQRIVVATADGKLFKDSGDDFGTSLKTGLGTNKVSVLVAAGAEASGNNRKLFHFNGNDVVQVLSADGVATTDLTTPPTDWSGGNQPRSGTIHKNRLWGWGNANDPHRVYYSLAADHEDFTTSDAGSISVYPGEGQYIIAGISFRGYLWLFKYPRGIYFIDTTSNTLSEWTVVKLTGAIGMKSPKALTEAENDVVFMDSAGRMHSLVTVQPLGDARSSDLTSELNLLPWVLDKVKTSSLEDGNAVHYSEKKEVHFGITKKGSTSPNARIILDFNSPQRIKARWSDQVKVTALAMWRDSNNIERPIAGDNAGFVRELDRPARTVDGVGFVGLFQTPHTDFSFVDPRYATIEKHYDFLELYVIPKGDHNLSVAVIQDGDTAETINFNMGSSGFILGTDTLGTGKLGGSVDHVRKRMHGSSYRLSLQASNAGSDQNFAVTKMVIWLRPSSDRLG